jgi:hypothetical protein
MRVGDPCLVLQDPLHLTERAPREIAIFIGGANVLPSVAQDQKSCNWILVRYQTTIERDHPPTIMQRRTGLLKQSGCFCIPEVVQYPDGKHAIEAGQACDFFKVQLLALEMTAIAKPRLGGFDVFRADVVAPILHACGKKGEDVGRTASYVQDSLPWLGTDESIHEFPAYSLCAHDALQRVIDEWV